LQCPFPRLSPFPRRIQGRLNDISILCSTHAQRDENGRVKPQTQYVLDKVARYERLFGITFYSSVVKSHERIQLPEALDGLVSRGLITQEESSILAKLPPKARHHAVIQWIADVVVKASSTEGIFHQNANLHFSFIDKITQLRATYGSVPDKIDDRMQLAYAHFVQMLVDSFLIVTPFAALAEMGNFSPFATFVLTLFFQGLMDLSKMFLDPFNNEGQGEDGDYLVVNTLIQESNAGSERFKDVVTELPAF
jgi:predicted membrane chloride channel (bestrophin family)